MIKISRVLPVFFLLIPLGISGCGIVTDGGGNQSSSQSDLATLVAATLSAMQPPESPVTLPPTEEAGYPASESILPNSLYFLALDTNSKPQLWKINKDGSLGGQLTRETEGIDDYDINPVDGRIAYLTGNRIIVADTEGNPTLTAIDAPASDGSDAWFYTGKVSAPLWTPDGTRLTFAKNGINLTDNTLTSSMLILQNKLREMPDGYVFPEELYFPYLWSPDGSRLLITIGYMEAGSKAVLTLASASLVQLRKDNQEMVCCNASWSADGSRIIMAGWGFGTESSDLWLYDPSSGQGSNLIPMKTSDGIYHYSEFPAFINGKIFLLYGNYPAAPTGNMLAGLAETTTSSSLPVTPLRPDSQYLNEVIWAKDGSLAVAVQIPPGEPNYPMYGPVILLTFDGQPTIPLTPSGRSLKWGL